MEFQAAKKPSQPAILFPLQGIIVSRGCPLLKCSMGGLRRRHSPVAPLWIGVYHFNSLALFVWEGKTAQAPESQVPKSIFFSPGRERRPVHSPSRSLPACAYRVEANVQSQPGRPSWRNRRRAASCGPATSSPKQGMKPVALPHGMPLASDAL